MSTTPAEENHQVENKVSVLGEKLREKAREQAHAEWALKHRERLEELFELIGMKSDRDTLCIEGHNVAYYRSTISQAFAKAYIDRRAKQLERGYAEVMIKNYAKEPELGEL